MSGPWVFLLGFLSGVVVAAIGFAVWTYFILREERRINETTACTPQWCPMTIETGTMTEEEIEAMPSCCSQPYEPN